MNGLLLKPRISEKAYFLSEQSNTYIFDVPKNANKFDIAKGVAGQYKVTVESVRLAAVSGKPKQSYRGRGRRSQKTSRSDIRKAYITLKEGDKLPIFAAGAEPKKTKEKA